MTKSIQYIREEQAQRQGQDAFEAMLQQAAKKQREADTIYGVKLMGEIYQSISPLFKHYIETQQNLRRKSTIYSVLFAPVIDSKSIDEVANTVAFIFGQAVVNKYSTRNYMTPCVSRMVKGLTRSFNIRIEDEDLKSVMTGGVQLVRHFIDAIDWLDIKTESYTNKSGQNYIEVTEEKQQQIRQLIDQLTSQQVFHKPMVCKPKKHFNLISGSGGYLTHWSPLLKHPVKINGEIHPFLSNFNDESFFNLINSHQEVGYKINKRVLDAIPQLIESGIKLDKLDYSVDSLFSGMQEDIQQEIKDKNNAVIERFQEKAYLLSEKQEQAIADKYLMAAKQHVRNFNQTIAIATEYSEFSEFFFPIFLDNRGRIYYYSKGLNPQGSELHKALLQFSQGIEMTEEGYTDSLIALGNALGYDKKTEEVRLQKAKELLPVILTGDVVEIASRMDPEQALTGLAIALDVGYYLQAKERGESYRTFQPLHVDSCNSGSQINGLLLRDLKNCELSNIINVEGDSLADTYLEVGKGLFNRMSAYQSGLFDKFLSHPEIFERKVFKKSSMVRSNYGGSHLTCSEDITYQMKDRHREFWNSLSKAEQKVFISEAVKEIDSSLPASNNYKKFAKKLVKLAVERDGCLAYHNPRSGFPVVLRENIEEIEKVSYRELYTGRQKSYNFKTHTKDLDKTGTISSTVPGITHSFDAAIIVSVKEKCGDIPMTTIHDSIAVLPGHVRTTLLPAIRETYYEMAKEDDLGSLVNELGFDVKVPYSDTLDIELVLQSKHLYS